MAFNYASTHHRAAVQVLKLVLAHYRERDVQDKWFIVYLEHFIEAEEKLAEKEENRALTATT
jgi:hypothetical protein